jgi:hypothetical protein
MKRKKPSKAKQAKLFPPVVPILTSGLALGGPPTDCPIASLQASNLESTTA